MALKAVYERFLQSPNSSSLGEEVTLSYVTTLTTYNQQAAITRHLEHQEKNVVKKKAEKVISAVEGPASIALVVETTLQFVSSGGAYLPGLDSFILDRVATLPITHIVHFDRDDKITQIRISWDQGDLLKQVEVIGTRGKNWPISDGKEQIKLISNSSKSAATVNPANNPRGRAHEEGEVPARSSSPSKRHIKDPHASLDLFRERNAAEEEEQYRQSNPNAVAPRESWRPEPRQMSELFAAGHEDLQPSPGGSPKKIATEQVVAPKGAGNRKFPASRIFDEDDEPQKEAKIYKTNPARYNHFDIGDHDPNDPMQHHDSSKPHQQQIPMRARTDRNKSQWDFEGFYTPVKVPQKIRGQDVVHFSFEDAERNEKPAENPGKSRKDAETHFDFQDDGTPVNRPAAAPKPRKDAETHFDFKDDPTPAPRRIIARTAAARGLYRDPIFDPEETTQPLSNVTNKGRRNDFSSSWDVADPTGPDKANKENKPAGNQRKGMEAHWDVGDDQPASKPSTKGARKDIEKSFWDF